MNIIDSQIHLFGPGSEEYARRIEQTIMSPEEVVAAMDRTGVSRAYLVPAGGSAGNATCIAAADRWPDRFRVMGIVGLDKPESRDLLANWETKSPFIGVRLAFAPFRKVSWLKDGTADWFWPEADRLGLPVMVWAPEQLDQIATIAGRFSRIRLIIDHMGLFVHDRDEKVAEVTANLVPLARFPNVAVKTSSLPSHSSDPYPYRNLHRHIEKVVGAFGTERLIWGSDLTRLPCSYEQAISMFTKELNFLAGEALEDVMSRNAIRWIGW